MASEFNYDMKSDIDRREETTASTNDSAIQRHMTGYSCTNTKSTAKVEPRDVILVFRITRSMADKLESYQTNHKKRDRTEAVISLLSTALFVIDKAAELKDPEIVQYLRKNLYNLQIVDDVMDWPKDRIDAIIGLLASERDRRIRLRIRK